MKKQFKFKQSLRLRLRFKKRIPVVGYVLILGFIVRLIAIDQSFWLDEATSGLVVRNFGFVEIINKFALADFHPPLYYLVLKLWSMIGGTGEIWLRGLSILFGLITIYVVYLIGEEAKDRSLGNLAALLMAIAPLHVYYSQEARMYAMGALGVSLAVYLFLRVIKGKVKTWEWVGFGLALLFVFMTDYLLILILPIFWGLALALNKKGKWWRLFCLWHLPLVINLIAWWPIFSQQLIGGFGVKGTSWWGVLGALSLKNVVLVPIKLMIGRVGFESRYLYGIVVLGFGALVIYLLTMTRKKMGKLLVVWAWFLGPLVLGMGIAFFVPVLSYFRFLFVLPAFYILLAAGLLRVHEKWFFLFLLTILIGNAVFLGLYFKQERFHREDWRGLVTEIEKETGGKNYQVLFVADSQMEGYRYYDSEQELYFGKDGVIDGLEEVWLMRYVWDIFDPTDSVRMKVEERGYNKKEELNFNGVIVWRYSRE